MKEQWGMGAADEPKTGMTDLERLILFNQYKILEHVHPDESEYYVQMQEVLSSGFVLEYKSLTQGIFEEFPAEECSFVR
jgi:uncharacterized protein YfbU (UPF0304 family)